MIYNFGSLNVDYVYTVDDFVKAGETIASLRLDTFAGGKGLNQSVALARAGANVRHCGYVSKHAGFLLETLTSSGVDVSNVRQVDSVNGHAIIQVNRDGQNCIMLYGGTNLMLDDTYAKQIADLIKPGDMLLFQNETTAIAQMMQLGKANGARIVLNPSPMNENCLNLPLELVDIFILNETEGEALTKEKAPDMILRCMHERFPNAKILLTLGGEGSVFMSDAEHFTQSAYTHGPVVDTTAAGDTFTGYYLACIERGDNDRTAVKNAAVAAGMSVTIKGASASIPLMNDVMKHI